MRDTLRNVLFWAPRGLGLLFASFVSLFALDVFGAGYGPWETALALLIHLLPVIVLLIALGLSWRWPWVGGLGFIGFALWYLQAFWARFTIGPYLMLGGLPLLIGLLFLADSYSRGWPRGRPRAWHPR